jgi:branched-chain amino acid transport system ATP-binding protein
VNTAPLLECRGLDAGYGKLTVARDINLRLEAGKILALLGPNGAGKTTVLLTLAGFLPKRGGSIYVDGIEVKGGSARRMNRSGLVLVPDSRALFTELTPVQNLNLAASRGYSLDPIMELFPALARRHKVRVRDLSGGEQQMLAMARALVQEPRMLLVDEMSMGLAPIAVESLMPVVRRVADEQGTSIILVEQHVQLALEIADDAIVLVHGSVAAVGEAALFRQDPGLIEAAYMTGSTSGG